LPCETLDPNPDSFEDGLFPLSPWSTDGDGDWALTTERAFDGATSLKSPALNGSQLISNATLRTCDDFEGGILRLQVMASVQPPNDMFVVSIDGVQAAQLVGVWDWTPVELGISPGQHRVDFTYQYNMFNLDQFPPNGPPEREGAVWLDVVGLGNTQRAGRKKEVQIVEVEDIFGNRHQ